MNFIFDIGNVLIDFKPKMFLNKLFDNPIEEKAVNEIIFKSNEWVRLDRGLITPDEACVSFCLKAPQYRALINETMGRLKEMLTPIPETVALLPEIKAAGHKLYFLSNYHKELSRYIQEKYPFFSLFDGGVFSCEIHITKPSLEIYRYFLSKYQLDPRDCLFFDDVRENIEAAEGLGMKGVLFTGEQAVKTFL